MIKRDLENLIKVALESRKAIIIIGPRQTGKTTLLKMIFENTKNLLWMNGDDPETRTLLEDINTAKWKTILAKSDILVVDEAQRIEDIGIKLKLVTDQIPSVKVIASGSSAFDLANKINEPLTGRKWEYKLYPLSFNEMVNETNFLNETSMLNHRLIFGYYPEVVNNPANEKNILAQLSDSYLYKDILMWERIKKPDKLLKLLKALAFQVGNEVSYNELGKIAGLDNQTVENYIRLLEQVFIIFRLQPLSRNLRKEIKTKRKIYFYDNGIRNALISQFQPIEFRQDLGALWENFLISERQKKIEYNQIHCNTYFWRTQDQQEIDYIEELDGKFFAYEFKYSKKDKFRIPKAFSKAYPNAECKLINRGNFEEFLL